MTTVEDARQRYFTEGTAEAAECYRRTVREVAAGDHEYVDAEFDPAGDCWTPPPCGSCNRCYHAIVEHGLSEHRVEAQAW